MATIQYGSMYASHFDLRVPKLCSLTASLRGSNDCLLYNANNLRKTSLGNTEYGAMTWVMSAKSLEGRSFFEPIDGGVMQSVQWFDPTSWGLAAKASNNWALGTVYPPAFYHLIQPHEQLIGGDGTIATTLNYWWVPGAPLPDTETAFPYFEVMTTNIWLPEDLQTGIAKYSSDDHNGAPGLWGTALGAELRAWFATHGRPLLWADEEGGPMLLDPLVASQLGPQQQFSTQANFTQQDVALFAAAWSQPSWVPGSFDSLAKQAPPHLHFRWQSWQARAACVAAERWPQNNVMGTDGNGACVFFRASSPGLGPAPPPPRWECLNDGTCAPSSRPPGPGDPRVTFATEAECVAGCGRSWECVRRTARVSREAGAAYCRPKLQGNASRGTARADNNNAAAITGGFASANTCETHCTISDNSREFLCHDWVAIVSRSIIGLIVFHLAGFVVVKCWVAPRQKQFQFALLGCCAKLDAARGRPWSTCVFVTCCPCYQWYRVLSFLSNGPRTACGNYCCFFGCSIFTACCIANPFGLPVFCLCSNLCGCLKGALTRNRLRKRLGISGTAGEDCLIHVFASWCALCQEALEISAAGHTGVLYQIDAAVVPLGAVSPAAGAGPAQRRSVTIMPIQGDGGLQHTLQAPLLAPPAAEHAPAGVATVSGDNSTTGQATATSREEMASEGELAG